MNRRNFIAATPLVIAAPVQAGPPDVQALLEQVMSSIVPLTGAHCSVPRGGMKALCDALDVEWAEAWWHRKEAGLVGI